MSPDTKIIFEPLRGLKVGDFVHRRQLPPDAVASVDTLVDLFASGGPDVRRQLNCEVDYRISFVFFMYAGQLAEQSVRDQNQALLTRGLIALAVENDTFDWRDSLSVLAQLYHSAQKLLLDADELFRRTADISNQPFRDTLLAFVDRSTAAKSIKAFGLKESSPPAPFCYETVRPKRTTRTNVRRLLQGFRRWLPNLR